ncbi:hypothetical protein ABN214_15390 [Proteus terrae]|uniref:hypothetical protein n=1 Tax=Proteus terrae TaxID=1574161 RepID=UPI0032D9DB1F
MSLSKRSLINKSKSRGVWLLVKTKYSVINAHWHLSEAKFYYMKSCTAKHSPHQEGLVGYYNDLSNSSYAKRLQILKRRNNLLASKYIKHQ